MSLSKSKPVLLGDSILRRLYGRYTDYFNALSSEFCVSGQTVADLIELVKVKREELRGKKVMLMIGTNDILRNNTKIRICVQLRSLSRRLRRLHCNIVWCEILPIPRLEWQATTLDLISDVNAYIRTFEPSGVKIVFSHSAFCSEGKAIRSLFCKYLGASERVDLVHPCRAGLGKLFCFLYPEL